MSSPSQEQEAVAISVEDMFQAAGQRDLQTAILRMMAHNDRNGDILFETIAQPLTATRVSTLHTRLQMQAQDAGFLGTSAGAFRLEGTGQRNARDFERLAEEMASMATRCSALLKLQVYEKAFCMACNLLPLALDTYVSHRSLLSKQTGDSASAKRESKQSDTKNTGDNVSSATSDLLGSIASVLTGCFNAVRGVPRTADMLKVSGKHLSDVQQVTGSPVDGALDVPAWTRVSNAATKPLRELAEGDLSTVTTRWGPDMWKSMMVMVTSCELTAPELDIWKPMLNACLKALKALMKEQKGLTGVKRPRSNAPSEADARSLQSPSKVAKKDA